MNKDEYSEYEEVAEDVYDEDYRQSLVENDEISLEEEAFLQGYEESLNEEEIDFEEAQ